MTADDMRISDWSSDVCSSHLHVGRICPVSLTGVAGSPFYYARYRKNGPQVVKSLKTQDVHDARRKVEAIAEQLGHRKVKERVDFSFRRFALDTIEADRDRKSVV